MRRNNLILLAVLVVLYLATSFTVQSLYGPSYGALEGENHWRPDGNGGWVAQGTPVGPKPEQASEPVPLLALYLPILVPGFVLILFMFTPLRRFTDGTINKEQPDQTDNPDNNESDDQAAIDSRDETS